jgi:hypothetical protein
VQVRTFPWHLHSRGHWGYQSYWGGWWPYIYFRLQFHTITY